MDVTFILGAWRKQLNYHGFEFQNNTMDNYLQLSEIWSRIGVK